MKLGGVALHASHGSIYDALYPTQRTRFEQLLRPVEDPYGVLHRDIEGRPDGLARLAAARASKQTRDIVFVASNAHGLPVAANLIANLESFGITDNFLLGFSEETCDLVKGRLACVWSTLLDSSASRLKAANVQPLWTLWMLRHMYIGRLARLGYNPMLLDADVILLANPFPLISQHLGDYQGTCLGPTPPIRPTLCIYSFLSIYPSIHLSIYLSI